MQTRRIVRGSGFALLVLAAIVGAAWVVSGWYGAAFGWGGLRAVSFGAGWVEYDGPGTADAFGQAQGWGFWPALRPMHWRYDYLHVSNAVQTTVGIPIWPVAVCFGVAGGVMVNLGRPRPVYLCAKCGYDLRGLRTGAPCPECGRAG